MCRLVWVVPQKWILRQGFRCEWFSWRVVSGGTGRGSGSQRGKEADPKVLMRV